MPDLCLTVLPIPLPLWARREATHAFCVLAYGWPPTASGHREPNQPGLARSRWISTHIFKVFPPTSRVEGGTVDLLHAAHPAASGQTPVWQVGIFRQHGLGGFGLGGGAGHVADQVHHGVAICDVHVELVERDRP
jgi:hypothetical protein